MITTKLKTRMLEAYETNLSKITLNGVVDVTEFESVIKNSLLTVQFDVPSGVKEIRSIAFYEGDILLSERQLYVPILNDTRFKYKVEVEN